MAKNKKPPAPLRLTEKQKEVIATRCFALTDEMLALLRPSSGIDGSLLEIFHFALARSQLPPDLLLNVVGTFLADKFGDRARLWVREDLELELRSYWSQGEARDEDALGNVTRVDFSRVVNGKSG